MKKPLIIYGAGDNGVRLALDIFEGRKLTEYIVCGFVDDGKRGKVLGFDIVGGREHLDELLRKGIGNVVVSLVGNPVARLERCEELKRKGFKFPSVYGTNVPSSARVGEGVFVHETSAFLGYDQDVADYAVIGPNTTIEGRTLIGRGTIVCPHAFVGYSSSTGEACLLGIRSTLMPNLSIGDKSILGHHVLQHKNLASGEKNLRY